ncbi:MAG: hypothetical protein ABIB47_01355 [Candidatus Woesearchaeota archaeon]
MRDEIWLAGLMHDVWDSGFSDVKKKNNVVVRWKGKWKNKFGHIRMLKNKDSEIGINTLFKDIRIPEFVIRLTIAHEIVHYMHGFHSPHPKQFRHPHKGGVVNNELKMRGYGEDIKNEKKWFKESWESVYRELSGDGGRIRVRQLRSSFRFF